MMRALAAVLFLIFPWFAGAQFQVPALRGPVMDLAEIMTPRDQEVLESWIREFHDRGKGQLQVLTVPNLGGLPIEQASIQITDQWKIGDARRDDGVLLLVSLEDRKIRIEVGQGLEGVIPDIKAKQIVSDVMVPFFRQGIPSQGILQGARQILREMDSEFQPTQDVASVRARKPQKTSLFDHYEGLFFLIFIGLMILRNLFGPRVRRRSFWGGGWGGGGFGGGGFGSGGGGGWSGGGGGFSGGGASGSW